MKKEGHETVTSSSFVFLTKNSIKVYSLFLIFIFNPCISPQLTFQKLTVSQTLFTFSNQATCSHGNAALHQQSVHKDTGSSAGRLPRLRGSSSRAATLLTILKRKLVTEQEVETQIAEQNEPRHI